MGENLDKNNAGPCDFFQHEPLDLKNSTIRVLRILHSVGEVVECKIWHDTLSNSHTCISYMWGDNTETLPIRVNGKLFNIHKNLYDFMLHARANNVEEPLWIDAICIDQQNIKERNHQVQQMADIYRKAQQVLVWPGHLSPLLPAVICEINWVASRRVFNPIIWGMLYSALLVRPQWLKIMAEVASLPYWSRLWIVQEILVGRDSRLIVEDKLVKWDDFAFAFEVVATMKKGGWTQVSLSARQLRHLTHFKIGGDPNQSALSSLEPFAAAVEDTILQIFKPWRQRSWKTHVKNHQTGILAFEPYAVLLSRFRHSECQDAKDRIYGLLGLTPEARGVAVRYDESDFDTLFRVALEIWPPDEHFTLGHFLRGLKEIAGALQLMVALYCGICLPRHSNAQLDEGTVGARHNNRNCSPNTVALTADCGSSMPHDRSYYNVSAISSIDASTERFYSEYLIIGCVSCGRLLLTSGHCSVRGRNSSSLWLEGEPHFSATTNKFVESFWID